MSYRLIDSNALAMNHEEINDMPCIYADLPNGLDGGYYDMSGGGGECEWVLREKWPNVKGDDHVYGYETGCGARHTWWPDSLPNYCPTCGRKAVKR